MGEWKKNEGMAFWLVLSYPDMSNFFMFYFFELASKNLSGYKYSKAYSYYKSGWLQPLQYQYCVIREFRKHQSIKNLFHKLWIILENTAKIRTAITHIWLVWEKHVAAALYRVEAVVGISLTNTACTGNANEWLTNQKTIKLKKIKDSDFSWEDFDQKGKK